MLFCSIDIRYVNQKGLDNNERGLVWNWDDTYVYS